MTTRCETKSAPPELKALIGRAWKKTWRRRHLVTILYECPCDNPKKQHHHPDYTKPYETFCYALSAIKPNTSGLNLYHHPLNPAWPPRSRTLPN